MSSDPKARGFAVLLAAIVIGVGLYRAGSHVDDPGEDRIRSDRVLIENAEYAIQQGLRDPSSAQFRNSGVHLVADSQHVVCGEVNSRNGYGGYAGFQRFVVTGRAAFLESQMDRKSFATVWKNLCAAGASWQPAYP